MSIKVGDLVMVVRPACCQNEFQGVPFRVQKITRMHRTCTTCGKPHDVLFAFTGYEKRPRWAPLFTLIKIDPPKDKQDERHDEEITA